MTSITIPSNVRTIGSWVFQGCTSLNSVTFRGEKPTIESSIFIALTQNITLSHPCKASWNGYTYSGSTNATLQIQAQTAAVTFDPANGNSPTTVNTACGGSISSPANPVRTGYTFDGWYNGSTLFDFATPAEDITLTARWTSLQLTISDPTLTRNKEYDYSTAAAVTAGTLSGITPGDDVTVTATATYDNKNAGINKTITVRYTLGGADAALYTAPADYVVTDGVITAKQITLLGPVLDTSKIYDGTIGAILLDGILWGALSDDHVTYGRAVMYDNKNVGTGKTITVIHTLGGADAANYIAPVNYVVTNGEITAKPLTITAADETIDYGETPQLLYSITSGSLLPGEELSGSLATDNVEVGTHPILQGTLTAGNNYGITFVGATLTVRSVDVSVSSITIDSGTAERLNETNFHSIADCGNSQVNISVNADPHAAVTINGTVQNNCPVALPNHGDNIIPITVTAQNGTVQSYTLTVHRLLPFEQIVQQRWNNTLTVINNPENNGGFSFTSYKWYRNGEEIGTGQSWSAGADGKELNPSDLYQVIVQTACLFTVAKALLRCVQRL